MTDEEKKALKASKYHLSKASFELLDLQNANVQNVRQSIEDAIEVIDVLIEFE